MSQCTSQPQLDKDELKQLQEGMRHYNIPHFTFLPLTPRWIPISKSLPTIDREVPVWGTKLVPGLDYPVICRLCSCHNRFFVEDYTSGFNQGMRNWHIFSWYAFIIDMWRKLTGYKEEDEIEYLSRMVGEVTHWLDYSPVPGEFKPTLDERVRPSHVTGLGISGNQL